MIDRLRDATSALSERVREIGPERRSRAPKPSRPGLRDAIPPPAAKPGAAPAAPAVDPELIGRRDRLIERFTVMQADLGGAFYEMAIRDHVRLDALTAKAAELQAVDAELGNVERAIELERTGAVGRCVNCDSPYGPGVSFCSQCGNVLERKVTA